MGDWEEFAFQTEFVKLEGEKILNVKALRVQWNGAVFFPEVTRRR